MYQIPGQIFTPLIHNITLWCVSNFTYWDFFEVINRTKRGTPLIILCPWRIITALFFYLRAQWDKALLKYSQNTKVLVLMNEWTFSLISTYNFFPMCLLCYTYIRYMRESKYFMDPHDKWRLVELIDIAHLPIADK